MYYSVNGNNSLHVEAFVLKTLLKLVLKLKPSEGLIG